MNLLNSISKNLPLIILLLITVIIIGYISKKKTGKKQLEKEVDAIEGLENEGEKCEDGYISNHYEFSSSFLVLDVKTTDGDNENFSIRTMMEDGVKGTFENNYLILNNNNKYLIYYKNKDGKVYHHKRKKWDSLKEAQDGAVAAKLKPYCMLQEVLDKMKAKKAKVINESLGGCRRDTVDFWHTPLKELMNC